MRYTAALLLLVGFAPGWAIPSGVRSGSEPSPMMPVGLAAEFVLTANLTSYGTSLWPPTYQQLPDLVALGNTTIPNYLGSVQTIGGKYFTLSPSNRIMQYRGLFYLVPANAKFSRDVYGQFCGGGWGWGSGNDELPPLSDGGLDAACREHDRAWDAKSPADVLRGDRAFLTSLSGITPRWQYEAEYIPVAKRWMECRVRFGVTVADWPEPKCRSLVVFAFVRTQVSRLVR